MSTPTLPRPARVIRVCATAGALSFEGPVGAQRFSDEELRAVVEEAERLERAIDAGMKIAFGTDAAVYPHGQSAREFAMLVERRMTPLEDISLTERVGFVMLGGRIVEGGGGR